MAVSLSLFCHSTSYCTLFTPTTFIFTCLQKTMFSAPTGPAPLFAPSQTVSTGFGSAAPVFAASTPFASSSTVSAVSKTPRIPAVTGARDGVGSKKSHRVAAKTLRKAGLVGDRDTTMRDLTGATSSRCVVLYFIDEFINGGITIIVRVAHINVNLSTRSKSLALLKLPWQLQRPRAGVE